MEHQEKRAIQFDSPKSDNGDVVKHPGKTQQTSNSVNDTSTIRERICFFEKEQASTEDIKSNIPALPSRVEMIKQRLLKKALGEEEDNILSGDDCELSNESEDDLGCIEKPVKNFMDMSDQGVINNKYVQDIKEKFESLQSGNNNKENVNKRTPGKLNEESDLLIERSEKKAEDIKKEKKTINFKENKEECVEDMKPFEYLNKDERMALTAQRTAVNTKAEVHNKKQSIVNKVKEIQLVDMVKESQSELNLAETSSTTSQQYKSTFEYDNSNFTFIDRSIILKESLIKESNTSPDLECAEITRIEHKQTALPTTKEIVDDFTNFHVRPAFLKVPECVQGPVKEIDVFNLHNGEFLVFSDAEFANKKFSFRAPGIALPTRPTLTPLNSIITEKRVLHYIKVSIPENSTSWMVLKQMKDGNTVIPYSLTNDENLSQFILTDVVREIYKRSNYLVFEHRVVEGKFLGKKLCLCLGGSCLKSLACENVTKQARNDLVVDGVKLSLSCELERNEWFDAINRNKLELVR